MSDSRSPVTDKVSTTPSKRRSPPARPPAVDDELDEDLDFIEAEPDPHDDEIGDPGQWPDDIDDVDDVPGGSSHLFDEDTTPIVETEWDDVEITDDADIDLEWASPAHHEPSPLDDHDDDIELPVLPMVFEAHVDGHPVPARVDLSLTQTTLSEWQPDGGERAVVVKIGSQVLSLRVAVVKGAPGLRVAPDVLQGRFLVRP